MATRRPAILSFLFCALLVGCGDEPPRAADRSGGAPKPRRGGTAVVAVGSDIRSVNELVSTDSRFNQDIIDRLFLRLLEEQPDYREHPPTFAPRLATAWEFSPDRRTLTFHLRPGLVWSDGEPITAEDVRWTWQAQTSPEVGWGYAENKASISDVEVVDAATVRFHFRRTGATQLIDAVEGVILPRHAWRELPFGRWRESSEWFARHLVVSGPFRLAGWSRQQQIVLERNDRYYDPELPYLDRVVFRIVPDKSSQVAQLESGELHFVEQLPPREARRLESNPAIQVTRFWTRQFNFVTWNLANPLFAEAEIRRALTLAIDRQQIIDTLYYGYARIATSPILRSVWAHNDALEPLPYDPAAAVAILERHGWRDTDGDGVRDRDGRPFAFELATSATSPVRRDTTVLIQDHLRRVGIAAEPRYLEGNALLERLLAHDFDAGLLGLNMDTSLSLWYLLHSEAIDNGFNFSQFRDAEADRLIEEAAAEIDPEALRRRLDRLQEIAHDRQPVTFLWEIQRLSGIRTELRNVHPNVLSSYFDLRHWWLEAAP